MTIDRVAEAELGSKKCPISFDRHSVEYRDGFDEKTKEMHAKCPLAWTDSYGGHWVAADMSVVFDVARNAELLSNDNDAHGERRGYLGINLPPRPGPRLHRSGFIEMDPPEQQSFRQTLNAYLSPAATARWIPIIDEVTRACLDERIESGSIDFIDDLANIVPAVLTMGLLGMSLKDWEIYCEPMHASVYTDPTSPEMSKVIEMMQVSDAHLHKEIENIRANPRPGLIDALNNITFDGEPVDPRDVFGSVQLLIGGGFDTTTALTSHALEWLSDNPAARTKLVENIDTMLDSATEEFLRFYTPAQGDGRTVAMDAEINGVQMKEGDRLWLSWAMANRDSSVFDDPDNIDLERSGNRHASFGLGVHRCIGSNVARNLFKRMLVQVLDRIPDYTCRREGAVRYPSIGVINGMQKLPATFTPGPRLGPGLSKTIDRVQQIIDEQRLAEPVTRSRSTAR